MRTDFGTTYTGQELKRIMTEIYEYFWQWKGSYSQINNSITAINFLQIKEKEINVLPHTVFIFTWQSHYSQKRLPGISSVHNNYGYIFGHNIHAIFSESTGNKYLFSIFQIESFHAY